MAVTYGAPAATPKSSVAAPVKAPTATPSLKLTQAQQDQRDKRDAANAPVKNTSGPATVSGTTLGQAAPTPVVQPTLGENFGTAYGKTGEFAQKGIDQLTGIGITDPGAFGEYAKAHANGQPIDWLAAAEAYKNQPAPGTGNTGGNTTPVVGSPQSDNINNFNGQATATTQIGAGQTGQGTGYTANAADQLTQLLSQLGINSDATYGKFNQSGDQAFNYLTQALQANVDPAFLENIQGKRKEADALTDFEFSNKGQTGGQLANQANDMNAYFANELGMAGPGNSANNAAQSELQARREAMSNAAHMSNLQTAQQRELDERNRISGVGTAAANTASGLANVYGDYSLGASGLGSQNANNLGNLGLGQQQVGATNMNTGLDAQNAGIGQGLASTGLEAQLKQAQSVLGNQYMQQILTNLLGDKNNKYNKDLIAQILPYIMQSGGGGGILGF